MDAPSGDNLLLQTLSVRSAQYPASAPRPTAPCSSCRCAPTARPVAAQCGEAPDPDFLQSTSVPSPVTPPPHPHLPTTSTVYRLGVVQSDRRLRCK